MNENLAKTYDGLDGKLERLDEIARSSLADDWRQWLEDYGIEPTPENIDAAVVGAAGVVKLMGELIGEAKENRATRGRILRTLLDSSTLQVAGIAALRPEREQT